MFIANETRLFIEDETMGVQSDVLINDLSVVKIFMIRFTMSSLAWRSSITPCDWLLTCYYVLSSKI